VDKLKLAGQNLAEFSTLALSMHLHHRQLGIHRLLKARTAYFFWLSSSVACQCLAVAPQSSAKHQFYSADYYITLNPICVAPRASKKFF
jgi:hypothetical protein